MRNSLALVATICTCFSLALAQAQKPLVSVPFTLVGEKIFMKARVNGSEEIDLQFDTGAGSTLIDSTTADRIKIVASGETSNEGAGGSISVPTSTNNTIELQGLAFHEVTLLHVPLERVEDFKRDIVIGYDMLKSYVIKVDFDTRTMEFYDAKSFRYTGQGKVNKFSLWSNSALMDVDLTLLDGKRLHGVFMVDNGADLPLLLNAPFVIKNNLMHRVGKLAKGSIGGSDGSEVPTFRGHVKKAVIGGYSFSDFPVRLTQAQSGTLSLNDLDGILGNPILRKFNITFDYRRKRMYWDSNHMFSQEIR